ncbi:hypothetical protein D3C80_1781630 [compost metagenome]
MVDPLEPATGVCRCLQPEVSAVDIGVFIHQVNQAAVRRPHGRQLQLVGTDQPAIRLPFVGHRPCQRTGAVLDPYRRRAQ